MGFRILRYDDEVLANYANVTADYIDNKSNYASMQWKKKQDPGRGWATPFVTGHKYKIHFGMTGLDYEQMTFSQSENWQPTDLPIHFVHNWTDVRQAITFTVCDPTCHVVENNTIPADKALWETGQNVVWNATENRTTEFVVSAKNRANLHKY